ncbi:MAG: hypothetical protein JNG89_09265, partial [Planctomycetaceae bacterium]|nr:hypothetical protein [Planctomycetaceae bacterium]
RLLKRRAGRHAGLVVTLHRSGRLPTLIDCRTSSDLLESIVARLAPDDVDHLRGELPALFHRHQGNIRLCLRSLYDRYAFLPAADCGGTRGNGRNVEHSA